MTAKIRVCLIDDDVVVLEASAPALRDLGYVVMAAPGAAAGLDIAERESVDAIVTDLNMPGDIREVQLPGMVPHSRR